MLTAGTRPAACVRWTCASNAVQPISPPGAYGQTGAEIPSMVRWVRICGTRIARRSSGGRGREDLQRRDLPLDESDGAIVEAGFGVSVVRKHAQRCAPLGRLVQELGLRRSDEAIL